MSDWLRPFEQIAYVAGECVAVRDAGFTEEALRYPRSEAGLVALCAFNGIKPEQAPPGWKYWPGEQTKKSWERVIEALWERASLAIATEAASVGRNAKRQDNADWLGPKGEHAVGEAETPTTSPSSPSIELDQ